jgi:COX Aromatic Rich Motif
MRFDLVSSDAQAFEKWVNAAKAQGGILDASTFVELAKPAKADGTQTFARVSDGLFDKVSSANLSAVSPQRGQ